MLPTFTRGRAIVGVCGAPFKCPPAPSECALLLHDYLSTRGMRDACEITLVMPFATPVPPSPDTSAALVAAFAERGISFVPGRRVAALDHGRKVAVLDDGAELPFDLFLGVPKHRAPDVVLASGLAEEGYVPVSSDTLETRFPGVYAVGDVATVGVPKAGVFAEGAARIVAAALVAAIKDGEPPGAVRRTRLVLRRVRRRPRGASRRRLPDGPEADRGLQRAVRGTRRGEGALRVEPPRALVRLEDQSAFQKTVVEQGRPSG